MSFVPKDGSGSLFKNDKQGNENRPDWSGNAMYEGKMVKIAGWEKPNKKTGEIYISLKMEAPGVATAHDKAKADGYQPQPEDQEIKF